MRTRFLFVIFTASPARRRDVGWRVLARGIMRGRIAWARTIIANALTRCVTRSPLVHVAVGDGHVVLSRSTEGDSFHSFTEYVLTAPRLAWMYEVPCEWSPKIAPLAYPGRKSIVMSALHTLTCGVIPARDCVTQVRASLRSGGHRVPFWITTPAQLFDWLRSQGHPLHELETTEGSDEGLGESLAGLFETAGEGACCGVGKCGSARQARRG